MNVNGAQDPKVTPKIMKKTTLEEHDGNKNNNFNFERTKILEKQRCKRAYFMKYWEYRKNKVWIKNMTAFKNFVLLSLT